MCAQTYACTYKVHKSCVGLVPAHEVAYGGGPWGPYGPCGRQCAVGCEVSGTGLDPAIDRDVVMMTIVVCGDYQAFGNLLFHSYSCYCLCRISDVLHHHHHHHHEQQWSCHSSSKASVVSQEDGCAKNERAV